MMTTLASTGLPSVRGGLVPPVVVAVAVAAVASAVVAVVDAVVARVAASVAVAVEAVVAVLAAIAVPAAEVDLAAPSSMMEMPKPPNGLSGLVPLVSLSVMTLILPRLWILPGGIGFEPTMTAGAG